MELLGDMGRVEACFDPLRDSVNFGPDRCPVCAESAIRSEIIFYSLVTWVKWKLVPIHLQTEVISVLCAEYTTGMEIFFAQPDGLLGDVGQIEAHFGLFGDSFNLDAR
jgi:hypothetical protein